MLKSKKAMLKYQGAPQRVLFDDEGQGHEIYEMKDVEEVFGTGERAALEAGHKFAVGERERMKDVDVQDKIEAREKKKEKKRKRKEREHEVRTAGLRGPLYLTGLVQHSSREMPADPFSPRQTTTMDTCLPNLFSPLRRTTRTKTRLSSGHLLQNGRKPTGRHHRRSTRHYHWGMRKRLLYRCCGAGNNVLFFAPVFVILLNVYTHIIHHRPYTFRPVCSQASSFAS
jgi:hypothetical protein